MTNRQYMESLTDEELADLFNREPWQNYANTLWWDGFYSMTDAIEKWLKEEREE